MKISLANENETLALGQQLAFQLPEKGLVFLRGTLGAGKTTLVRGILKAFGHQGSTKSPTYTIVEPYSIDSKTEQPRKIYHFDLYRLSDAEELEYMGIRDYLDEMALSFIEWPENGSGFLPEADFEILLSYNGETRQAELRGFKEIEADSISST